MTTPRYLLILGTAALGVACFAISGSAKPSAPASGATVVLDEDAEVTRIERLFSNEALSSRAAPRTWSSRFDVRWNARWQAAPKYVV